MNQIIKENIRQTFNPQRYPELIPDRETKTDLVFKLSYHLSYNAPRDITITIGWKHRLYHLEIKEDDKVEAYTNGSYPSILLDVFKDRLFVFLGYEISDQMFKRPYFGRINRIGIDRETDL